MGNKVRESIIGKVKEVCYFSLMLDSTPDVSHQEQVSLIVRYMDVENFEIKESFLGYVCYGSHFMPCVGINLDLLIFKHAKP